MKLSVMSAYTELDNTHNSTLRLLNRLILNGDSLSGALSCLKKTSRYYYDKQLQELMEVTWWLPKPYLHDYYHYGLKDLLDLLAVGAPQQMTRRRVVRRRIPIAT